MRKYTFTLLMLFVVNIPTFAQELHIEDKADVKVPAEKEETAKKLATALGIIYVGMSEEDLYKTGFTKYLQKGYRQKGNEEWITFSDWTTEISGDLITFHLVDDKIKGWERHKKEPSKQGMEL